MIDECINKRLNTLVYTVHIQIQIYILYMIFYEAVKGMLSDWHLFFSFKHT